MVDGPRAHHFNTGAATSMLLIHVMLFLLPLVGVVWAYSDSVPTEACQRMLPGHKVGLARSPPPYRLTIYHPRVLSNMTVPVCLVGAVPLMGFMVQAQDPRGGGLGSWLVDDPTVTQAMTCTLPNDTMTHVSKQHKQVVSLRWLAPLHYNGTVVFKAAVVKEYSTFWTDITSKTFTVHRF